MNGRFRWTISTFLCAGVTLALMGILIGFVIPKEPNTLRFWTAACNSQESEAESICIDDTMDPSRVYLESIEFEEEFEIIPDDFGMRPLFGYEVFDQAPPLISEINFPVLIAKPFVPDFDFRFKWRRLSP